VVCDEHAIGGSGEYYGDNDAHLGRINVFYHEAFGGKYVLRASLEPGVIGVISPTHKRTEGRAPVWGSEFTSKRRRTTGGIQQNPL
jgi:hypothetical protein